ncbi:DUF1641 domain-containing protein [Micrococcales bacterium 31B]|nr:DUF1641 domain-containing protein [Micrococcales bacterium 31B]
MIAPSDVAAAEDTTVQPTRASHAAAPPAALAGSDKLAARLEDPQIVESLNLLLDNVGLLAILVSGLDGLLARGETILSSLSGALTEFKEDARLTEGMFPEGAPSVALEDVGALLSAGAKALPAAGPALDKAVDSGLLNLLTDDAALSPEVQRVLGVLITSLRTATADAQAGTLRAATPLQLVKELRDPDFARGLSFAIQVLHLVGRDIGKAGG